MSSRVYLSIFLAFIRPPAMFPALLRCGFLLSTLPFWALAQTNPDISNTAQSDTIREEAHTTDRGGQALIFAPTKNRRTFRASKTQGLPTWQESLYIAMTKGAADATDFYRLPSNRVIELGQQLII